MTLYELISGEKSISPRKALKGDMENVVAMAMRVEPERRYSSAVDLAADARRAIEGFPVRARHDTLAYRMRRFIARRPAEFALMTAMSCTVIVAAFLAYHQYRNAERRFEDVRATANSFLFGIDDALEGLPGTTRARMLVVQRGQQYLNVLARDRSSDLSLQRELASAYRKLGDILGRPYRPNLGDFAGASQDYAKSAQLFEGIASAGRADAAVYTEWGQVLTDQSRIAGREFAPPRAVTMGEKAVDVLNKAVALDPGSRDAQIALHDGRLALVLARLSEAHSVGALDAYRKAAADGLETLNSARLLVAWYPHDELVQGELAAACEYRQYTLGDLRPASGISRVGDDELRLVKEEVDIQTRLFHAAPDRYRRALADSLSDLARILPPAGQPAAGEKAARESLQFFEEIASRDRDNLEAFRDVAVARWGLARALAADNHPAQAAAEYEKVLADYRRPAAANPADKSDTVIIEANDWLALWYLRHGRRGTAAGHYQSNIEALTGASAVEARIALAMDKEGLDDLLSSNHPAQSAMSYRDAVAVWKQLGDSGQVSSAEGARSRGIQRKLAKLMVRSSKTPNYD